MPHAGKTEQTQQNDNSPFLAVHAGSRRGALLLLGTTAACLLAIGAGRHQLSATRVPLTPETSPTSLWRIYRWSIDPSERRDAALLMVSSAEADPHRQQRLLEGQGWGQDPLAAIALGRSAAAHQALGQGDEATGLWSEVLERFPTTPAAAEAMQQLAGQKPALGLRLLDADPAHPAALAVAADLEPSANQHRGALHLARWGPGWPGAAARMREACQAKTTDGIEPAQRQLLARALARLGAADDALGCLRDRTPDIDTALAIGRALLYGDRAQQRQGEDLLVTLANRAPSSVEALEAARLLSDPLLPELTLLAALPESLRADSAAVAAGMVRLEGGVGAEAVLERWPDDPASWQLQWDVARDALLEQRWSDAQTLLERLPAPILPGPLEGRRRFWLGYSHHRQEQPQQAEQHWSWLIAHQPPGYYRWRAQIRLNRVQGADTESGKPSWSPLNASDNLVNRLWRLGLVDEAWDAWRSRHIGSGTTRSQRQRLIEGRLRIARGDTWTGLDQLWRLSLRWQMPSCDDRIELQRSQFPRPYAAVFQQAAEAEQVAPELLLAIAKQESRFAPAVASTAGAQGLMQLMPATAEELADRPLSLDDLREPALSAALGARYLNQLLEQWAQDPVLAIASYNAGPGNASRWNSPEVQEDPELWVERIPYPETRYYVKKVLANWIGYRDNTELKACKQTWTGQPMAGPDAEKDPAPQAQDSEQRGG